MKKRYNRHLSTNQQAFKLNPFTDVMLLISLMLITFVFYSKKTETIPMKVPVFSLHSSLSSASKQEKSTVLSLSIQRDWRVTLFHKNNKIVEFAQTQTKQATFPRLLSQRLFGWLQKEGLQDSKLFLQIGGDDEAPRKLEAAVHIALALLAQGIPYQGKQIRKQIIPLLVWEFK